MLMGLSRVAFLLATATSFVNPISISNLAASKTTSDGIPATGSFTFKTDRTVVDQDGVVLDTAWLLAGYTPGNYSVRVTVNSGNTPTGTVGSWVAMSSDLTWSLTDASGASGLKTATLGIEIKDNASGIILGTATYTLTADSQTNASTTFNPVVGSYSRTAAGSVSYSVTASASSFWTWSSSGNTPTCNVPSGGGSAVTITFSLSAGVNDKNTVITLHQGTNTWTLNLTAQGDGGGATMTL